MNGLNLESIVIVERGLLLTLLEHITNETRRMHALSIRKIIVYALSLRRNTRNGPIHLDRTLLLLPIFVATCRCCFSWRLEQKHPHCMKYVCPFKSLRIPFLAVHRVCEGILPETYYFLINKQICLYWLDFVYFIVTCMCYRESSIPVFRDVVIFLTGIWTRFAEYSSFSIIICVKTIQESL